MLQMLTGFRAADNAMGIPMEKLRIVFETGSSCFSGGVMGA